MDQSPETTSQRAGTITLEKFLKTLIFAWIFLFVTTEIEQYFYIGDVYPFACNVVNSTLCVILCMRYGTYL